MVPTQDPPDGVDDLEFGDYDFTEFDRVTAILTSIPSSSSVSSSSSSTVISQTQWAPVEWNQPSIANASDQAPLPSPNSSNRTSFSDRRS